MSIEMSSITPSVSSVQSQPTPAAPKLISLKSFKTLWLALTLPDDKQTADQAASTLFRFFRSNHVNDLRLIFGLVVFVFLIHVAIIVLLFSVAALIALGTSLVKIAAGFKVAAGFKAAALFVHGAGHAASYIAPAFPIYGAVLAWSYLSALKRLGVVDLFACEIGTLCNVGSIFDVGKRYIEMSATADQLSNNFVSKEDYFPIFDKGSQDLQSLEALVVANITEFYTYMKAMRDSQRRLEQVKSAQAAKSAMLNVIYMLFLGYESGRKAIKHLVEYEPTQATYVMGILLTELTCYSFLCPNLAKDELRFSRLTLRLQHYELEVPELMKRVERYSVDDKDWGPAKRTLPELKQRYNDMLDALRACGLEQKSPIVA
jgi:hypothetical protein